MRQNADTGHWESARVIFSPADEAITFDGRSVALDRRSVALLLALLERAGAPVSKDDLMARAWPDRMLHENSIAKGISKLRAALEGSDLEIVTVHGFGYRLKEHPPVASAAVEGVTVVPLSAASGASTGSSRRLALVAAAIFVAVIAIASWLLAAGPDRMAPLVPVRTAPPVTNDPAKSVGTVLWVDDHPENNALDVRFLRSRQVAVHLARSTEDALRLLAINDYDLMISDLGRGEDRLAGTKLIQSMRARGSTVPTMIYTIRPEDPAKQRAQRKLVSGSGATELALTPVEVREKALAIVR